jgi:carboxyl-terminal processing protease
LLVGRVFRGSPAAGAGIAVGDVLVAADGRSLAGLGAEQATALIKGPEGTAVTVGVLRPSTGKRREVRLTREEIQVPIVTSSVREVGGVEVGYVRFASFTEGSHGLLRRAVRRVQRQGAEALVLDLRHNGGGILQEAVLAASVFLPEGELVVSTRSRTQGSEKYRTSGGSLPPLPIVVLIDRASASAAEILAAALADRGDATLVGTRTFGKGVFQQEIDLSNGGAVKLTVGEYFTPDGTNLAGTGVQPGIQVRDLPATAADEGLRRALEVAAGQAGA